MQKKKNHLPLVVSRTECKRACMQLRKSFIPACRGKTFERHGSSSYATDASDSFPAL